MGKSLAASGLIAALSAGIIILAAAYWGMQGAEHADLPREPHIVTAPAETGRIILRLNGSLEMSIRYSEDGTIRALHNEPGLPNYTVTRSYYPGQTFISDCEDGAPTRLILYQYRGITRDGNPEAVFARYDVPATDGAPCEFPGILAAYPPPYDPGLLARLFDPAHPYLSDEEAAERHRRDTYAAPIRDAITISRPTVELLPAVPFTEEARSGHYMAPEAPSGKYPGWIRNIWHNADGSITISYRNHDIPSHGALVRYMPGQTFAYGCYDHIEPTLLYLYQYRGIRMINGTPWIELAGLDAYSKTPVPCAGDILRSSIDAYDPALFGTRAPDPDPPPLPDRGETLIYDTYTAPLQSADAFPQSMNMFPVRLLAPESYLDGPITGMQPLPNGSITITYGGPEISYSQNYLPGQMFVFDCVEHDRYTGLILHRYEGISTAAGEEYLAYTGFGASTRVPVPCMMPEIAIHAAKAYGGEWFDARDEEWREITPAYDVAPAQEPGTRADYMRLAGAEPVFEPRMVRPLADPPEIGYMLPQPFGFTSARHHPEDDSVTLNYTSHGRSLGGIHSQTYNVNQTFAYKCEDYDGHKRMKFYQYRGTNTFQGGRSLVLVHFELDAPGDIPCTFPHYLEHTIDVYDAGGFDMLHGLDYGPADTTYAELVRHAVIYTPVYVDAYPLQRPPDGSFTYGYWIGEITHNPDDSISVTYLDGAGRAHTRDYNPGQTFLASCSEYEDASDLRLFSYRGSVTPDGIRALVMANFGAYTKAHMPCTYPDVLDSTVDALDTSRFDWQYNLEWRGPT